LAAVTITQAQLTSTLGVLKHGEVLVDSQALAIWAAHCRIPTVTLAIAIAIAVQGTIDLVGHSQRLTALIGTVKVRLGSCGNYTVIDVLHRLLKTNPLNFWLFVNELSMSSLAA